MGLITDETKTRTHRPFSKSLNTAVIYYEFRFFSFTFAPPTALTRGQLLYDMAQGCYWDFSLLCSIWMHMFERDKDWAKRCGALDLSTSLHEVSSHTNKYAFDSRWHWQNTEQSKTWTLLYVLAWPDYTCETSFHDRHWKNSKHLLEDRIFHRVSRSLRGVCHTILWTTKIFGFCLLFPTSVPIGYMSHSQMLGKVEYGWGPIFKVVLEC